MINVEISGRVFEVSKSEHDLYTQAEQQFKDAQARVASLGTLAACKARMLRELDSYRMNIRELMQGASPDLLSAIQADVDELTKTLSDIVSA